ncbi:hypothetical protein SOVF_191230 [Spinacia oleracea]|nr:hypothetical protein SOVF_191230 [Spinacia oleracea]
MSLISGLQDEVLAIRIELESISIFIKYAEERADEHNQVKVWVRQVRKLAHGIQDVMEEYKLLLLQQHTHYGINALLQYPALLYHKRNIAIEIKALRKKAVDIRTQKEAYVLPNDSSSSTSTTFNQPQHSSYFQSIHQSTILSVCITDQESQPVGAETAKNDLIQLLDLHEFEDTRILTNTIAMIGMSGLGKTTYCLKDKGVVYVSAGLFKNRSLETLHLDGNCFSGVGVEH